MASRASRSIPVILPARLLLGALSIVPMTGYNFSPIMRLACGGGLCEEACEDWGGLCEDWVDYVRRWRGTSSRRSCAWPVGLCKCDLTNLSSKQTCSVDMRAISWALRTGTRATRCGTTCSCGSGCCGYTNKQYNKY